MKLREMAAPVTDTLRTDDPREWDVSSISSGATRSADTISLLARLNSSRRRRRGVARFAFATSRLIRRTSSRIRFLVDHVPAFRRSHLLRRRPFPVSQVRQQILGRPFRRHTTASICSSPRESNRESSSSKMRLSSWANIDVRNIAPPDVQ